VEDLLQDHVEVLFAFTCMLCDLQQIRIALTEGWIAYKDGRNDLVPVALTANTAIELARRLEEDMARFAVYKDDGVEALLDTVYFAQMFPLRLSPTYQDLDDIAFAGETYDLASQFFWPTYKRLQSYLGPVQSLSGLGTPIIAIKYGAYNPLADRSKMSGCEKLQEDQVLLDDILSDLSVLAMLASSKKYFPVEDEFTKGFSEAYTTGKPPLWVVFAAQCFLDAHHVLREKASKGWRDLDLTGRMRPCQKTDQVALLVQPTACCLGLLVSPYTWIRSKTSESGYSALRSRASKITAC
jgi:hypothetical protein